MDANKETLETWDKVASLYEEKFMDLELYNDSYNYLLDLLGKNARILDVGCGPGNITRYLLSKRPDLDILGIDTSANMIALAVKNNPAAKFSVMDCRQISELADKFDAVVCGFCLPYLTRLESKKFFSDMSDLLTANGIVYLSFVEGESEESGFKVSTTGDRVYFHYHSLMQIKMQLSENGFKEPEIFRVGYEKPKVETEIHTILVAARKFA